MLDETHAWILPHYQQPSWWEIESNETLSSASVCSDEDMRNILRSVLFVDSLKYNIMDAGGDDAYYLVSLSIHLATSGKARWLRGGEQVAEACYSL